GPWTDLLREPRFVSKAQKLNELLQSFRATRNHLAIVRDEYGGIDGLVTIEDVLEEIVGEIEDESDEDEVDGMTWIDERTVDVEGDTHVSEVNERLGLELPEPDDFETLAGFVIHELRRIPKTGESLDWHTLHFTVIDADERRINRLRLKTENRLHPFLPESSVAEEEPRRSAESET
ncbi:MAG: transporter associated domain-containing protein, partial [Planctomycetota bacterium]